MKINNSKKGFIVQGVIALVALVLIGGGAYLVNNRHYLVAPVDMNQMPIMPANSTSDWKTYINDQLNYSIKYPVNYKIVDYNVSTNNKFVSAISLQISDPVNQAIEFNPLLTVDIIKQPYSVDGKIFTNARDYVNYRYKNLQDLSVIERKSGDASVIEVSGKTQSEVSSELLPFKMLVGINNGLVYEISYYPVNYKHFSEIARSFKFTSQKTTSTELKPSITVISPNGGETLKIGQTHKVTFNFIGNSGTKTIRLNSYSDDGIRLNSYYVGTTESASEASITIPNNVEASRFGPNYKIQILVDKYDTGKGVADESDASFSIIK